MFQSPVVSYSAGVLAGRWVEKRVQDDGIKEKFISDYKEGKLKLQRTRLMKSNLLAPVLLASPDQGVRIGTVVQIVAPDVQKTDLLSHYGITLASTVTPAKVDENSELHPGCPLLCSPNVEAVRRNTWRILGADGKSSTEGAFLKFGQNITIVSSTPGQPLYIRSPKSLLNNRNAASTGTPLHLSTILDRYCLFRIMPVKRHDKVGDIVQDSVVKPFTRVYINHLVTNENLCIENVNIETFFGIEKVASVKLNRQR